MQKIDIIKQAAGRLGAQPMDVMEAFESCLKVISASLVQGKPVYFRGFGAFTIQQRAKKTGRTGFNAGAKGEAFVIPAHNIVKFKPSRSLKAKVAQTGLKSEQA